MNMKLLVWEEQKWNISAKKLEVYKKCNCLFLKYEVDTDFLDQILIEHVIRRDNNKEKNIVTQTASKWKTV